MKKLYYSVKRDSFIDYITVYDNELKVFAELESLKHPDTGERFMSDVDEIENYLDDNGYGDEEFDIISIEKQLNYLEKEIENERISYTEIAELELLSNFIEETNTLLLQWAGVPEK